MGNIEKVILALIIVSTIIIVLLVSIKSKTDTTNTLNEIEIVEDIEETEDVENKENTLKKVDDRSDFYAVEGCVAKFYTYYANAFKAENLNDERTKPVYYMLDEAYIKENEITEQNLTNKLNKVNGSIVTINEMYVNQKSENIYVYIAKGRLREISTGNMSDFQLMLMLDMLNETFTVFPNDYIIKKYSDIKLGEEVNIIIPEKIEENDYNTYDYEVIDDEEYVIKLIDKYKEEIFHDIESAYNHLDEEYREKRFETLSDFKKYIKQNTTKNVILKVAQYRKRIYDDYTEYVCIDTKGNYYIFKEKTVMNYGMILDTYTVDLPDFIKKYDNQSEENKVGLNINKVVSAINEKDYKYVYNKLNDTYKNTYFSDYNTFETYLTTNFYNSNEIKVGKIEDAGKNTYNTKIKITDINNAENTKEIIVIVRLLEDRNFEMSFGM